MNWLFFVSKKSECLDEIADMLAEKNAVCETLFLEDLQENEVDSSLVKKLNEADYAVLNFCGEDWKKINAAFAAGYALGKSIVAFFNFDCVEVGKNGRFIKYSSCDSLRKILKKNLKDYVTLDEQNRARKILFERGIPFTSDAFSFEISKNDMDAAELFIEAGMDVNARDASGTPVICIAARNRNEMMLEWLLKKGADIDAVSKDRGYSAVMDAVWRSDVKMVERLIAHGANVNFVANDGQTALIIATGIDNQDSCEKICGVLVKNGADPHFKDHMDMSSMNYAVLFKKEKLIDLFKEYSK